MFVSIIGIPWGRAAFNIAVLREKTTEFEFQHIEHDNGHDG